MLEIKALTKTFGANLVLDIPDLQLDNGIYWLQGPNGSGKSTLMKILAGLLPFKGTIFLNDISPVQNPIEYRLQVNHAPAEPLYPSFLNGDDLITFSEAIKKSERAKVAQLRAQLQVGAYTANPIGSYSSGMVKKLSLLIAFLGRPTWILLDEPFTTVDHDTQRGLSDLIVASHKKGISFILTSHHDMSGYGMAFTKSFRIENTKLKELNLQG